MFTGTMLYRAEQGQFGRWRATLVATGIFAAAIVAGAWHIPGTVPQDQTVLVQREWVMSVALAGLTFAIGMALRNLRVPAVLAWLGLVSYSVYLLHPLFLDAYDNLPFAPGDHQPIWLQLGAAAVFLAVLLACCAGTYYLLEAPMQRLGRRGGARVRVPLRTRPICPLGARPAGDAPGVGPRVRSADSRGQRSSRRAASSRWLLTSSADARLVTHATRLDRKTSPITRATALSSFDGSPSCMALVSICSISRATALTSAAALGSANMNARVIASVSIGSRCMVRVIRPSTYSIRS